VKDIRERTFEFAVRIIKLCQYLGNKLSSGHATHVISKQLIRAGTSIGANVEEAQAGQSKPDFSKYAIALKASRETLYWLRLLAAKDILPAERLDELQTEAKELMRIIGAIIVSAKGKN
jgi:four helix bundle protein